MDLLEVAPAHAPIPFDLFDVLGRRRQSRLQCALRLVQPQLQITECAALLAAEAIILLQAPQRFLILALILSRTG
jgi:hypothetical protein